MYIVQWCDQEGIQQERRFERLRDAFLEADSLSETYDGVRLTKPNGKIIVWQ